MKVRVTRTSAWFTEDSPPCEGCTLQSLPKLATDERMCKSFEEFDERFSAREGTWLSKGINHKVHQFSITRQVAQVGKGWYLNFKTLTDLKRFIEIEGECVLYEANGELVLEIYDDYRE